MKKTKVGIIGTGNIGTDLLLKIQRNPVLECGIFAGRSPNSKGIQLAKDLGVQTSFQSIDYIVKHPDCCEIVFDATSAKVHEYNAPILKGLHKFAIDMTPAHVGKFCVPVVNLFECLEEDNVNLITCGGQATVPIACAIKKACTSVEYLEIVATISSKSAGAGTRNNIDEFTQSTRDALSDFSGVENTKAIIILNPAEPPITMRNTVYAIVEHPDMPRIVKSVEEMEKRIQEYVPGYKVVFG
ncbi:MAG: acetaldehyde dehydrogenase (acetylating), partial [Oscillospiraceae bacterium]